VRLAVTAQEEFAALAAGWSRRSHHLGLGIATGYPTMGRVGYESRYEYTAIGAASILASRLSDKARPSQILISPRTHAELGEQVAVESVGPLELKGFGKPVDAFSVVGPVPDVAGN